MEVKYIRRRRNTWLPGTSADESNSNAIKTRVLLLLELTRGDLRLTGQVSALGTGRSLLYIWTDAGDSGVSGRELSEKAVALICEDLGVSINRADY